MSYLVNSVFLVLIFLILFTDKASAVTVSITNPPASIGSDPFSLSVSVSGASSGINYLRVDIFQEGTSKYFGETFNGNDWYGDSDGTKYFPITIGDDRTWNGIVQARIGNTIPTDYDGTGTYTIRLRRYTAAGNYNNDEAKASTVNIALVFPTLTPIPTNTPTPEPTVRPTVTPKPSSTPTPTKSKSASTPTISIMHTTSFLSEAIVSLGLQENGKTSTLSASLSAYPTSILGTSTKAAEKSIPTYAKQQALVKTVSTFLPQYIAISIGGLSFMGCGILMYIKKRKDQSEK